MYGVEKDSKLQCRPEMGFANQKIFYSQVSYRSYFMKNLLKLKSSMKSSTILASSLWSLPLLLLATMLFSLSPFALAGENSKKSRVLDRMVATVNNETITESELGFQSKLLMLRLKQNEVELPSIEDLKKQILERMVLDKLQLQLAAEVGVEVDDTTLNKTLEEIASRDGLPLSELQKFVEEEGIPFEYFRDSIKRELTISRVQQQALSQQITISKTEVDNFLNSPEGQDQTGVEYHLGHILIPLESSSDNHVQKVQQEAQQIVKRLRSGGNFQQVAIQKSKGQQALNGGDLGFRKTAEIPSLFAKEVPRLKVGEVLGPIKNDSGFHIVKLFEKRLSGGGTLTVKNETHVRQILIKPGDKTSDKEAQLMLAKVRDQIVKGALFTKMAEKYSQEAASAPRGGDIGWVTDKAVVPAFFKQVSSLKPGEISQPFKTELGWHLIQVVENRLQQNASEMQRNKAMDILSQRKFEEHLSSWLKRLREDAEIKTYL